MLGSFGFGALGALGFWDFSGFFGSLGLWDFSGPFGFSGFLDRDPVGGRRPRPRTPARPHSWVRAGHDPGGFPTGRRGDPRQHPVAAAQAAAPRPYSGPGRAGRATAYRQAVLSG